MESTVDARTEWMVVDFISNQTHRVECEISAKALPSTYRLPLSAVVHAAVVGVLELHTGHHCVLEAQRLELCEGSILSCDVSTSMCSTLIVWNARECVDDACPIQQKAATLVS